MAIDSRSEEFNSFSFKFNSGSLGKGSIDADRQLSKINASYSFRISLKLDFMLPSLNLYWENSLCRFSSFLISVFVFAYF